ncbi:MAG: serine/threonine-protein kinase [Rhodoglobus sp.]
MDSTAEHSATQQRPIDDEATAVLRGRYRLGERLAAGGMGAVFRATDERLGREVAVKVLRAVPSGTDGAPKQEDEVNFLAGLNHHGLVTLLDAGVERTVSGTEYIYLVMELVEGLDLARRLEGGALSPREVAYFGMDTAEALDYIHERGVVHRDIKPANLLVVSYSDDEMRPRVKLADFGIATLAGSSVAAPSDSPSAFGTAAYLSPEQVAGEPVGTASDIYSLGLVLLECLTGALAFEGEPVESAVARLVLGPGIPESIPAGWRVLLASMTAREPGNRPAARDLYPAMRGLLIDELGRHRAEVDAEEDPGQDAAGHGAHRRD